jgi:hypothetical protein
MTDQIRRLYHQHRSEGLQASLALAWAKSEVEVMNLPYDGEDGEEFEEDGFVINIMVEPDDDAEMSWLGEFTDHPGSEFAFERTNRRHGHSYKFFVPSREHDPEDYRKLVWSKHAAYLQCLADSKVDWEMAEKLSEEGFWSICVTASQDDEELGSDSIGGVDLGYVRQAIRDHDLLGGAIAEAKEAVLKYRLATMATTY